MRRVFYNCGEDWLSTKEFIWLVVNLRFHLPADNRRLHLLPEGLYHRTLCWNQMYLQGNLLQDSTFLAVGCNIPGRSTIVCIVCSCINIVYFRHCCDLPQTLLILCSHQCSCDPVTVNDTGSLSACDCGDVLIPVIY